MRRAGLRVWRAIAIQQVNQMRHILRAVAPCRTILFFDRQKSDRSRRVKRWKRASVQFIGEAEPQRVVLNGGHGAFLWAHPS